MKEKGSGVECQSYTLMGTWFSGGLVSVRLMGVLRDLRVLFQLKQLYDPYSFYP